MHGTTEDAEGDFPHEPRWSVVRLVRIALWRERRHTETVMKDQLLAIRAEIASAEERLSAKLDGIDTSVSLIAGELVRHGNDPPPNGSGS